MLRSLTIVSLTLILASAFGALAAFTDKTGHWLLFVTGTLAIAGLAFLAGRYSLEGWATILGAAGGLGASVLAMLGNYAVHVAGIGGLESRDFGSPDTPGWFYVLASLIILSPLIAGASVLTSFLAWAGHSWRFPPVRRRPDPARG
jgi:hypothetical protein